LNPLDIVGEAPILTRFPNLIRQVWTYLIYLRLPDFGLASASKYKGFCSGIAIATSGDMNSRERIKALRAGLGLTQEGLARRVGVTLVTVARWERENYTSPSPLAWAKIQKLEKEVSHRT
jgi:DNA-binding XRE family transcriptional regulator